MFIIKEFLKNNRGGCRPAMEALSMKYLLLSLVLFAAVPVVGAQAQDKPAEADAQKSKSKTKFQQLTEEKDELKAQYELVIQAQRTKAAQLEAE